MLKLNLKHFFAQCLGKLTNLFNLDNNPHNINHLNHEQFLDEFDQFDQDFKPSMSANFKSKLARWLINLALWLDHNPKHDYFTKIEAEKEKIMRNLIIMLDEIELIYQTGNLDLQITVTPCLEGAIADTINLLMMDFRQAIADLPQEHLLRQKYQNLKQ